MSSSCVHTSVWARNEDSFSKFLHAVRYDVRTYTATSRGITYIKCSSCGTFFNLFLYQPGETHYPYRKGLKKFGPPVVSEGNFVGYVRSEFAFDKNPVAIFEDPSLEEVVKYFFIWARF